MPPRDDGIVDHVVLDALVAGRLTGDDLRPAERVWIVGELTGRGVPVTRICDLTGMSRRTVQRLRVRAAQVDFTPIVTYPPGGMPYPARLPVEDVEDVEDPAVEVQDQDAGVSG